MTTCPHWLVLVYLLREIALDKGITHRQIAEKSGLQPGNVSRILTGRYVPRLDIFLKVAQAIGVNFFLEDRESRSDLNQMMERAMEQLGRRPIPPTN